MGAIRTGTTVNWGQIPFWYSTDEMYNQQVSFREFYLNSANMPIIYQAVWSATDSSINEMYVPSVEGDVVNCIFKIYGTTKYPIPSGYANWELLAEVKKSRDIANTNYVNGGVAEGQRFTIDISKIVADQLSYSLVPIGKGSWENQEYGGMNGGAQKQDNVIEAVSPYNVTPNGCYRTIAVKCSFEILNANLAVELSTTTLSHANSKVIRAINSVPSFSSNTYLTRTTILEKYSPTSTTRRRALTNCPNNTTSDSVTPSYMKSVNPQSKADFLYFYVRQSYNPDEVYYNIYEVYGKTYNKNGTLGQDFVLGSNWKNQLGTTHICSDISHNFQKETADTFSEYQSQIAVQNVAPGYINSHAYAPQESNYPYVTARTPITSDTSHYCLWVRGLYDDTTWVENRHSSVYWYSINREDASDTNNKELFQNVTFHWLNTKGGIDTYTARRDILESITSNKSLMETKLPNRRYMQDDADTSGALVVGDYYSDTMRGFDTYKGGSEVLNVNAKLKNSAYTEPLSYVESNWLREIFQSPNVWIEERTDFDNQVNFGTDAPYHMKSMNPYLRPESIIYKPVIITNSEVVSLDQEKGLVMYNIEYTISQGVLTQRN